MGFFCVLEEVTAGGGTHKHPAKLDFSRLKAVVQERVSYISRHRSNTKLEVEEGNRKASMCST